jgi:hypothetical protein
MWYVWGRREMHAGLRWGNVTIKRPLGIPRTRGEENIKMAVEKIEYCVD